MKKLFLAGVKLIVFVLALIVIMLGVIADRVH